MEALWNLEDKFHLSTQKAIALFACTSLLLIGVCLAAALRRMKFRTRNSVHQEPCKVIGPAQWADPPVRCSVVQALMRAVRWSGPSKWDESLRAGSERETPTPLLVKRDDLIGGGQWQSHNSTSAVWQRPILMGEKCELPRFSGLILYDQMGLPLHQCEEEGIIIHEQEKSPPAVRTTLRDLL
ncbi:hypothetical protein DH2020_011743 [Rehmannia glutinosa]|uniref:Transmembrane protein n=1 Tax=Rehmannia glutinosa TaxID=99300 RepID=A0ABR0XE90_REHGL